MFFGIFSRSMGSLSIRSHWRFDLLARLFAQQFTENGLSAVLADLDWRQGAPTKWVQRHLEAGLPSVEVVPILAGPDLIFAHLGGVAAL